MKTSNLSLLGVVIIFGQLLPAQTFTEVVPAFTLDGVYESSVAFADVDGDGDNDLLITGWSESSEPIAKLYTNDDGIFTEAIGPPLEGVRASSVAFADVDGDGDHDLLITGMNGSSRPITKLYANHEGHFREVLDTPFEPVAFGSVAFSDVDGDGDYDLLITGLNRSVRIAKLYTNDGGSFTEAADTPFEGVYESSVAFADVDGDGDNDVLITGRGSSSERIAKLYTNDGGSFTEVVGTPFEGVAYGSIAFSDIDGDGDNDLLITGDKSFSEPIAKLYTNDGGSFTEVAGTPFDGVSFSSSIAFSDVDSDGDNDVIITGRNGSFEKIAKLYTNVEGSFTEAAGTPFEGVYKSSVAFSDVDSDGDNDVLITGWNGSNERVAKLYTNEEGSFTDATGLPFRGVRSSSVAFSDVDGDGDQDVLITGINLSSGPIAKLYTNNGARFTEVGGNPFEGVWVGSVAFSDVDGDGDQDLLITGQNRSSEPTAKLYSNNEGSFTEVADTPFEGVRQSSIAFSDVDGDDDNDVLITGWNSSLEPTAKLYTNDGGSFTEAVDTPFASVGASSVAFSDVDGDGDDDVLITGRNGNGSSESTAKLYSNDGGRFTESTGTPFEGVAFGSVSFSDVDGDGDNDVLITGLNASNERIAKLYANAGGRFTEVAGTPFWGVGWSSAAFSDVDNDGDNDVLITGQNGSSALIAQLYTNDGGGFTEVADTLFDGVLYGSVAFSDVDNDGDDDVLITGDKGSFELIAKLYTNDGLTSSRGDLVSANRIEFTLYPNPTQANNLNIRYHSEGNGLITIKVFDLNGRPLRQQQQRSAVGQQTFSVDIASLKKGSYFIQLDDGKVRGVRKFLIQ